MLVHKMRRKSPVVAELLVGDHDADWSLSSLSPTPPASSRKKSRAN